MGKTGKCSVRMTVALLVAVFIAVCTGCSGDSLSVVKLDNETDAKVSTFSWDGDSFTLPCGTDMLLDAGYMVWKCYRYSDGGEVEFDPAEEFILDGKEREGYFTVDVDKTERFCVCVANTEEEEQPPSMCMIYSAEILPGEETAWSYMGLTTVSRPEDVKAAFDGILEFNALEGYGNYRLIHEDRDRLISFYWGNGVENGITQFILEAYPEGEYRNYGGSFMDYTVQTVE